MDKVTALLVSNTAVNFKEMSGKDFMIAQEEVKNPMVIFCNLETTQSFERFHIVAKDKKELKLMYKLKIFYTSSIPEDETRHIHGAIFYGVKKDKYKKKKTLSCN
jgi:hypothetical protein